MTDVRSHVVRTAARRTAEVSTASLSEQLALERERAQLLEARVQELETASAQLESYASDLSRTYAELRRHLQHMTVLHEAQVLLSSALDPKDVLAGLLDALGQLVPSERVEVYLSDLSLSPRVGATSTASVVHAEDDLPRLRAARPDDPGVEDQPRAREDSLVAQGIREQRTVRSNGGLAVPLRVGGQSIGALLLNGGAVAEVTDEQVKLLELLAAGAAVATQNAFLYQETQRLAITDSLTGLSNHRHFHDSLNLEVERARRMDYPVGFLMMDLDHFKLVNDRFLHPTGNAVLRHVADVLRQRLRRTDVVGRLGGEEFGAILPGATEEEVAIVAEKLRRAIAEIPPLKDEGPEPPMYLTMSVGGASLAPGGLDPELLEHCADQALYRAKQQGRNQVRLWSPDGEIPLPPSPAD